jgi:hypothetical protein
VLAMAGDAVVRREEVLEDMERPVVLTAGFFDE